MKNHEIYSISIIIVMCYIWIEILKRTFGSENKIKNAYPLISMLTGVALGVLFFLFEPSWISSNSIFGTALAGAASGLSATGGNQMWKHLKKKSISLVVKQEDAPARFFITGDKHRHFECLVQFCKDNCLTRKDTVIILGDTGFNYFEDERDDKLKQRLCNTGVTLFCLHGNKENRAENILTYGVQTFCGGEVYYEPKYPNIFFAKDGEVYTFNGKKYIVVGGAHSIDKYRCLEEKRPYWEDEMPSDETKKLVENKLLEMGNKVDGILTHTCPISCLPIEMFVSTRREAQKMRKNSKRREEFPIDIDHSTEEWLETIKKKNEFDDWYCGHYHVDKVYGNVKMMYKEILPLAEEEKGKNERS